MGYYDGNAHEDKLSRFSQTVADMAQKFKSDHTMSGYSKMEVDYFLDELIKRCGMNIGAANSAGSDKQNMFETKYQSKASAVISGINGVRFTQGFKGYDVRQVDEYLEHLISLIKNSASHDNIRNMIDINQLNNAKFSQGFRGYDFKEVNEFIDAVASEIEKLNRIKREFV